MRGVFSLKLRVLCLIGAYPDSVNEHFHRHVRSFWDHPTTKSFQSWLVKRFHPSVQFNKLSPPAGRCQALWITRGNNSRPAVLWGRDAWTLSYNSGWREREGNMHRVLWRSREGTLTCSAGFGEDSPEEGTLLHSRGCCQVSVRRPGL